MSYTKRVWSETERETAYPSDFNRIEEGIEANDLEITNQKNPTIPGTLANKINVLNELTKNLTEDGIDLSPYLANGWTKDEWYALKAYKVGKIVFVCGVINNGVTTAGTQVFQGLPEELRNSWRAPIVCGNGVTMVGYPDGSIILPYAHSVTQITLSSFYRLDM